MIWGIKDNQRVKATPKSIANCPECQEELIAKCGEIKIWHWAHRANTDCDNWSEPETKWHLDWKSNFLDEQQEVIIGKHRADIKTRSGRIIELQNSTISSTDIETREEFYKNMIWLLNGSTLCNGLNLRQKNGIITFRWKTPPKSWWFAEKPLFIDLDDLVSSTKLILNSYLKDKDKKHYATYKTQVYGEWEDDYGNMHESQYPHWETESIEDTPKYIEDLKKEISLLDNKIFLIKKIYKKVPCGGWGVLYSKEQFLKIYGDIYGETKNIL